VRSFALQLSGRSLFRALWLPAFFACTWLLCASEPLRRAPALRIASSGDLWTAPAHLRDLPHELDLELTVTFYDPHWKLLWGIDRDGNSYWPTVSSNSLLQAGQRVHLSGNMIPSEGLPLESLRVSLLEDRVNTPPLDTTDRFTEANHFLGRLVTAEGFVNSQTETDANHIELDLTIQGVPTRAYVLLSDHSPIPQLSGAFVRLTGVYDANMLPHFHVNLWVPRPEDLVVTGWLDTDPRFKLPRTPIDQLVSKGHERVRVTGEVHSQVPGEKIILRDDTGQVTLNTTLSRIVPPGERIEAVGIPLVRGVEVVLREAIFRVLSDPPPKPQALSILRLADQVRQLPPESAQRGYAVRLGGVVTWSHPTARILYLNDASGGISVTLPPETATPPSPGSTVQITGYTTAGSFAPEVQAEKIASTKQVLLLDPRPITIEQAMTGVEESQWVSLTGYARDVVRDGEWSRLHVSTSGGDFVAVAPHSPRLDTLKGAVIRIRGVCRATTDKNLQLTGIEIWAHTGNNITVEEPLPADPFVEPLRSIASLRRFNPLAAFNRRAHVAGTVLHHEPGAYLHLQDEQQALMVLSRDTTPLQPGDRVEAVGFPGRQGSRLVLRESTYRRIGDGTEPPAAALEEPAVLHPELDGRLVTLETAIVEVSRHTQGVRFMCQSHGTLFEALLDGGDTEVAPGSHVALRGVYVVRFDQDLRPRSFHIQLRSGDDVAVLRTPSWWTVGRTMALASGLALAILLGLAWVFALRRRVNRQTDEIRRQLEKSSRLEAELVRTSRLDSLGILAGGIAHDFNNLLTVILGNLSLVLNDRNVNEEDERFLREGERAAIRARDLTQQLLTFAKGGAPVRSAVLLADIVRESAEFALHGSRVRCEFDFASDLWPAHVDRGQISQVAQNIVINAMHAMPTGGVIRIILRNEDVGPDTGVPLEPGRYLRLSIRDSGTGIAPELLPHIFDPFFTTKQKGSGLGLATVHSIVRKHGGHITVESTLGAGTVFHLWLPAAQKASQATTPKAAPRLRLSGRALVMDDEPPVREMAAAMLRRLGLEVAVVADGAEAIDAYVAARSAGRPFTLVLLDLTVPGGMGGKEALAELLRIDPNIRAIVSSGYSNDPVMAHYREHGFQARVPKPYELDQLAAAVCAAEGIAVAAA
jgi:Signal transduction histidine kinase